MPGIPKSPAKGRSLEAGPAGKCSTNLGIGEPENLPHQPPLEACQCPARRWMRRVGRKKPLPQLVTQLCLGPLPRPLGGNHKENFPGGQGAQLSEEQWLSLPCRGPCTGVGQGQCWRLKTGLGTDLGTAVHSPLHLVFLESDSVGNFRSELSWASDMLLFSHMKSWGQPRGGVLS